MSVPLCLYSTSLFLLISVTLQWRKLTMKDVITRRYVHLQLGYIIFYSLQTENDFKTLGGKSIANTLINCHELFLWPIWRSKNTAKTQCKHFCHYLYVVYSNLPFYLDSLCLLLCGPKMFFLSTFYPFLSLLMNLPTPISLCLVSCQ